MQDLSIILRRLRVAAGIEEEDISDSCVNGPQQPLDPPDCLKNEPTLPENRPLLAWASEMAEHDVVLTQPVNYVEAPLRKVTTLQISSYAIQYLKTVIAARFYQEHPALCWGQWTSAWWRDRGSEAMNALASLKAALEERAGHGH